MQRIYLDYNASTPVAPDVASAMREAMVEGFGNPSSGHWAGAPAREVLEAARARVAGLLGCAPSEIVFTSGGSEANNLALKGMFFSSRHARPHFISSTVEHPAIVEPLRFLERLGATVTWLPVDGTGRIDPDDLRLAITRDTVLVSIMHANNEVGTIQPVEACARIAADHGIPLHTDAAQSAGKIDTTVDGLGVDLLSLAGHKCYAPKGVGALYVRNGIHLEPLLHGAGHESGRRAGTESALLAAALGKACELVSDPAPNAGIATLRDRLWAGLQERFGASVVRNGHATETLPNTLSVSFAGRAGADVLAEVPELAASTGSACHSGKVELSSVLAAMGVAPEVGMGTIRFSLGRYSTMEDVEGALAALGRLARD